MTNLWIEGDDLDEDEAGLTDAGIKKLAQLIGLINIDPNPAISSKDETLLYSLLQHANVYDMREVTKKLKKIYPAKTVESVLRKYDQIY